jgi:hypothetical protein
MTSSETPTERPGRGDDDVSDPDVADDVDPDREGGGEPAPGGPGPWPRIMVSLITATAVAVGWGFIAWHYHFRIKPASVFLCLGWLAVVLAVRFLWQTGFQAADDDTGDAAWWRPTGKLDELVREKRSLLKAIKEIEFDREMGKTSEDDAGAIVKVYRARAIDVIKAIDALQGGEAGSVRDEIEREVRARMQLTAGKKGKAKARAAKAKAAKAQAAKAQAAAAEPTPGDEAAAEVGATDDTPDRAAKAEAVQQEEAS